jgi:hypothetical protein
MPLCIPLEEEWLEAVLLDDICPAILALPAFSDLPSAERWPP